MRSVSRGHDERRTKKDQITIRLDGRMFGIVDRST